MAGILICLLCGSCRAGCIRGTMPVGRYPWVEHRGLSLDREELTVRVGQGEVTVDVLFEFGMHGPQVDQRMFFPAGEGGEVTGFAVTLEGEGLEPVALDCTRVPHPGLPVGEGAGAIFEVAVEARHLVDHGGRMRVRYTQDVQDGFTYILRSGSYWRGPIGELVVEVLDPNGCVVDAMTEGERFSKVGGELFKWKFVDLEPRGGLVMELGCQQQGQGDG